MPGEDRWRVADALEWLRRKGITGIHYKREELHYVFFEAFEEHWRETEPLSERIILSPDVGVEIVYRTYPTNLTSEHVRDPRSVAGGKRTVRCFKFFHDQKNYGRAFDGEIPYSQREQ
jgi:hypothetical protein